MVAATSPLLWYVTRATATVGLVLLTGTSILGILTLSRLGFRYWPRWATQAVHRATAIMALVFVALHVGSTVFDNYVTVPLAAAVVPGTSPYRGLEVSLGTIAFDLLLIVLVSSLIRNFIPIDLWRRLHYLTYAAAPVAFLHVLLLATDVRKGSHWMLLVLGVCTLGAVVAFVLRILRARSLKQRMIVTPPTRRRV